MKISNWVGGLLILFSSASVWSMECTVNPGAEGCTMFSKCRKAADAFVSCDNLSGFISSSAVKPERVRVTTMTSSDSKIVDGRFVRGKLRDLGPMTFDLVLNRTVEDLYFKRDEINNLLTNYGFGPNLIKDDNFKVILKKDEKIYTTPLATQLVSPVQQQLPPTASNAGYIVCTWLSEPTRASAKCSTRDVVCTGRATCSGNGKFSGAPPTRVFALACDGKEGQCPSAIDCFHAPEPASMQTAAKCGSNNPTPQNRSGQTTQGAQ